MSNHHQDAENIESIGTGSIGILPVHSLSAATPNRQDAYSPSASAMPNRQDACSSSASATPNRQDAYSPSASAMPNRQDAYSPSAPAATPNRHDACSPSAATPNRQDACSPSAASGFMRPHSTIDIRERNLPHWCQDNTLVFVTWRLADSLPQSKLEEIEKKQKAFLSDDPEPWDVEALRLYRKRCSFEMESFLDSGCGACVMKDERIRNEVESAFRFFDGSRYRLHAFVVMPNHVHVLFEAFPDHPLNSILHSWKSYTANVINKRLKLQGRLWEDESWDRLIRNETHYHNCVDYIRNNNPSLACILVAPLPGA